MGSCVGKCAVAAAPKRKVSFGVDMSPAKVVVGWHGNGADCSEAEEAERGLSLFGGASSEVRRCNCSVVV
jgi:hypothetical protein